MGRWRHIGIVGGLGARASAHFYRLLVDLCSERYHASLDSDYPYVVLVSLASEGLSEVGIVDEAVLIPELREVLRLFNGLGVNTVAVPCCSIYAYLDRFSLYTSLQIIDLYREIAETALRLGAKDVVVLCSRGLRSTKGLASYFHAKGIESHYSEIPTQDILDQWIMEVIAGRHSTQATTELLDLIDTLVGQRDAVVLACSELSVLLGTSDLPANAIDSMRVLADATLREAYRSSD